MVNNLENYILTISSTMEYYPGMFVIKDPELRYVYVNSRFASMTSKSAKSGIENSKIINEKMQLDISEEYEKEVIRNRKPVKYQASLVIDNIERYFEIITIPIFNRDGKLLGLQTTYDDIDTSVQVQKYLQYELDFIETLLNNLPYAIYSKNHERRYTRVNDAFLKYHSLSDTDIIGMRDEDVFDEELTNWNIQSDNKVRENQITITFIFDRSGEQPIMITKIPLINSDDDVTGIIGIYNPYIDKELLNEELITKQRVLSIAQLSGGISHDLNNTLTVIIGLASFLLSSHPDDPMKPNLEMMYQAGKRAANIVDRIATFGHSTPVEAENSNITLLLNQIISLISKNSEDTIRIEKKYKKIEHWAKIDEIQFTNVIMNILQNSLDSMQSGTIYIDIAVESIQNSTNGYSVSTQENQPGKYVRITIEDEGTGIDSFSMSRLFEPYFTTKKFGQGLGLSVVHGIIVGHQGMLNIANNQDNKGVTVDIYLPYIDKEM